MGEDGRRNGARGRITLPAVERAELRGRVEAALGELAHILAGLDGLPVPAEVNDTMSTDRLLTVEQVAERTGLSAGYVYKQAHHWEFTRKLGPKALRFSEAGLERWMNSKRTVDAAAENGR
jgi:excisionase family DNA binding protein